jgi:hypothetical protein
MMGHKKIESTLQYARVDKSILRIEMMSLQEKMDSLKLTDFGRDSYHRFKL